jgi:hypothetical protein
MFKNVKPLQHAIKQKFSEKKIIMFDIETGTVVGDALFGAFALGDMFDGLTHTKFTSMNEFLTLSLNYPGYTFFAHNGKGYELNYLLDPLRALVASEPTYSLQTVQQGQAIIEFVLTQTLTTTIKQGRNKGKEKKLTKTWKYADTLPLFADSLEKVTKAFCPDVPKLTGEIDFQKEVFDTNNPRHIAYLERDSECLYVAYRRLEKMIFAVFQCGIGLTAGSTALKAFQASIPEGVVYYRHNPYADVYARESLRGGIVLPGTTTEIVRDVSMYDAKAAYGFHMLTKKYPIGASIHTFKFNTSKHGIYRCTVSAPTTLPVGCIAERGCSIYPLGTFQATCTSVDIVSARSHGYTIEIEDGYYWEEEAPVFQAFAQKCQELETREVVASDGTITYPFKPLAKLLRNSLFGKFGTKASAAKFVLSTGEIPKGAGIVIDKKTGNMIEGLYSVEEVVDENYMIPAWASFITANQRAYLMERVYRAYELGASSVYCDTDSLTTETVVCEQMKQEGLLFTNGLYGSWEFEAEGHLLALAPKVYALVDATGKSVKVRAKGLPIHSKATLAHTNPELQDIATFATAALGVRQDYDWRCSNSVRTRMLHPELPIVTSRHRMISDLSNSKAWNYDALTQKITPVVRGESGAGSIFKSAP